MLTKLYGTQAEYELEADGGPPVRVVVAEEGETKLELRLPAGARPLRVVISRKEC